MYHIIVVSSLPLWSKTVKSRDLIKAKVCVGVILILAAVVFAACSNPAGGNSETGTITISLAGAGARFSYPPTTADRAQLYGKLTLIKDGAPVGQPSGFWGDRGLKLTLVPGTYLVNLEVYYWGGDRPANNGAPPENELVLLAKSDDYETANTFTLARGDEIKLIVNVYKLFAVAGVTVNPYTITVPSNGNQEFNATVTISEGLPQDVTWKITSPATLKPGTAISTGGLLTVGAAETDGTILTITATSTLMDVSGTATVTVGTPLGPPLSGAASVTVTGNQWVGQVLKAELTGTLTGTTAYQWKRDGVDITGATNNTYTLVALDVGHAVSVVVSNTDYDGSITGALTETVLNHAPLPSNATVAIAGTHTVGSTLTAQATNFPAGTLSYQWKKGGVNISGATNPTYTIVADDAGAAISVEVRHPDYSGSVTSASVTVTGGGTPPTGNTFNVSSAAQWAAAVTAINSGGNGASATRKSYTINVTGNFSIDGVTDYTFGSVEYIEVTINGSGTISLNSTGNLLRIRGSQTVTLKGPTLQGRNDNNGPLVYLSGVSAIFNMESGIITGNKNSGNTGGGVGISSDSKFNMTGGKVTGNTAGGGGGVAIFGGTFYLIEGEVSGNTSTGSSGGGGVYGTNGTGLYMSGGKITGNTSTGTGTGGGVMVGNVTFRMTGGEVSGNKAASGGGVYVFQASNSIFRIENGIVYGSDETGVDGNGKPLANTATNTANGAALYLLAGGTAEYGSGSSWTAIPMTGSSTTSRDETIEVVNGKLTGAPEKALIGIAVTTLPTKTVYETTDVSLDTTGMIVSAIYNDGTTEVVPGGSTGYNTMSGLVPSLSGSYLIEIEWQGMTTSFGVTVLPDDCTTINVANAGEWNTVVTTTITAGNSGAPKYYRINVIGSFSIAGSTANTFTADDIDVTITGGGAISLSSNGSLLLIAENQTVTLDGLTLQGRSSNGASLVTMDGGTFIMNSGSITGNTVTSSGNGGGVTSYGTFTMNGGKISGNTANQGGGVVTNGTFTMNGGEVSGNTASGTGTYGGGGVFVGGNTFTMNGGKISGNTATSGAGGGVYVYEGTFRISNGTVYGSNESVEALRNTATGGGAALYRDGGTTQYGKDTTWESIPLTGSGANTRDNTIRVVNGELVQ